MPLHAPRLRLIDLFALIAVVGLGLALLMPAINAKREAGRRNVCVNKLREIGLALQSYHSAFGRFPALSTEPFPQTPGATGAPATGFSWLVLILPYLDEVKLHNGISQASQGFAPGTAAFSGKLVDADGRQYSTFQPEAFLCPSFSGKIISDLSGQAPYANIPGQKLSGGHPVGIGISNYVALSATDIDRMRGGGAQANGVIIPRKGLSIKEITDGTSSTAIACETRERRLNAWMDGGVNWVVGADPNNTTAPTPDVNGFLILQTRSDRTALNVGPGIPPPTTRYLTQAKSPNGYEWTWGPSSEHTGGVIFHLFADGSVLGLTDDQTPTVYVQYITATGKEPVVDPHPGRE